jgi:hypothetical protein
MLNTTTSALVVVLTFACRSGLPEIQTKDGGVMEQESPFEGRIRPLRADVLVSLAAVAPLFRLPARWR